MNNIKFNLFKIIIIIFFINVTNLFSAGEKSPNVECMFAYSVGKSQECYDWYKEVDVKDIEHLKSKSAIFKKCIVSNCGSLYFDEDDPIQKRNSYQYRFLEKKQCEEISDLTLVSEDMVPTYFFQGIARDFKDEVEYSKDAGKYNKSITSIPFKMKRLFCPSQEVEQCLEKEMAFQFPIMCYKNSAGTSSATKELLKQCVEGHNKVACDDPSVKAITKGNMKKTIAWVYCDEDKNGDLYPESISTELYTSLNEANISCDPNAVCKKNQVCTATATCDDVKTIHKEDFKSEKCTDLGRPYRDYVVEIGCNAYSDIYRDDPKCARINSIEQGRDRNQTKQIHIKSQQSGKLDDYVEYISYRKYPDIDYSDTSLSENEIKNAPLITKEIFMAYFNPYDYKKVKKGPSWLGTLVAVIVVVIVVVYTGGTALAAFYAAAGTALVVGGATYIANPPGTYTDKTYIVDPGILDRTVMLNYTVNSYDRDNPVENITYKKWTKSGWFKKKTTTIYMGSQYNKQLVKNLGRMGKDSGITNPNGWLSTNYWKWNGRTPYRLDYGFDANLTVAPGDAEIIGVYNINNADTGAQFPETQIKTIDTETDCIDNTVISGTINTGYPPLTKQITEASLPKRNIASMGLIIPFNGCYTFKFYDSDMHYDMEKVEHKFSKPFQAPNLQRVDSHGNSYAKTCEDLWIDSGYTPEFKNVNDDGEFTQAYPVIRPTEFVGAYNLDCSPGYKFRYCDAIYNGNCMVDNYMMGYNVGSRTVDEPQSEDDAPLILYKDRNGIIKSSGTRDLTQHPDYDSARGTLTPTQIVCDCTAKRGVMKGDPSKTKPLFVRTKCFYPGDNYPITLEMIDAAGAKTYADIFPEQSNSIVTSYTNNDINNATTVINTYTTSLVNAIEKVNSIKFIHNKFPTLLSEEFSGLDNDYFYPIDLTRESYYQSFNIRTEDGLDTLVAISAYTDALNHIQNFINNSEEMPDNYPGWSCNTSTVTVNSSGGTSTISPPSNKTSVSKINKYVNSLKPLLENANCSDISNYTGVDISAGASECEYKKFTLKTAMCNLYNKNVVDSYEATLATEVDTFINSRFTKADELANIVYNDFPKVKDKVNEYLLPTDRWGTPSYESGTQENNLIFKSNSTCGDYQQAKIDLTNNYTSTVNQIFTFANYSAKLLDIKNGLSQLIDDNFDSVSLSYKYNIYNKTGTSKWDKWHTEVMGSYSCTDEHNVSHSGSCKDDTNICGSCSGYSAAHWGDQDGSCSGDYTWYKSNDSQSNGGSLDIKSSSGVFDSFGQFTCDKKSLNSDGDEDDVCKISVNGSTERNLNHDYGDSTIYTSPRSSSTWSSYGVRIKSSTTANKIKNISEEKWMQEHRYKNGYGDVDNSKNYQNVLLHYQTKDTIVKNQANNYIRSDVKNYIRNKVSNMFLISNTTQVHSDIDSPITVELDTSITNELVDQYPKNLIEGNFAPFNFIKIIDIFDDNHSVDKDILTPGGLYIKEPNRFYITVAAMKEVRQYRCYGDWDICSFESDADCTLDLEHQPNPKYTARVTDFEGKNIPILKDEFYKCKNEVDIETCNQFTYTNNCSKFDFPGIEKLEHNELDFAKDFSENMSKMIAFNEMAAIFGAEELRCESGYFWDFSWLTDPFFYLEALTGISLDMFSNNSDAGDSIEAWTYNEIDYSTCSSSWASYMIEAGCGPLDLATQVLDSQEDSTRMCDSRTQSQEATRKVRYTNAGCRDFADPLGYELSDVQKDSLNTSLTEELGPFEPFVSAGITYLTWADYLGPLEGLAAKVILKLLTDTFSHCNQCTNLECAKKFAPDEAKKVYKLINGKSELTHYSGDEFGLGDNGEPGDYAFEMYGNCYYKDKGCAKKILRHCVRKKYNYCCYSTRLSTVLVGQIYKQMGWTFKDDGCNKVVLETLSDVEWEPCKPGVTPGRGAKKCINYKAFQDYIMNRIDWSITKSVDLSEILDGYLDSVKMLDN